MIRRRTCRAICSRTLPAQVDGELGVGVGDRLVLADETTQCLGQLYRARAARPGPSRSAPRPRRTPLRRRAPAPSRARPRRRDRGLVRHDFCSSRTSGRIFFSSASTVTGRSACSGSRRPCRSRTSPARRTRRSRGPRRRRGRRRRACTGRRAVQASACRRRLVLVVQPDERDELGLAELDQQRMLLAAGDAPRRPHVEQPHLALHVGRAHGLVGGVQLVAHERGAGLPISGDGTSRGSVQVPRAGRRRARRRRRAGSGACGSWWRRRCLSGRGGRRAALLAACREAVARSVSARRPPSAIRMQPPQIHVTNGLR